MSKPFDCIAFDLDDTLLDTRRLLAPKAARESALAMIAAGLETTVEEALKAREELFLKNPRAPLYERIVDRFKIRHGVLRTAIAEAGRSAFFQREITEKLTLTPDAENMLQELSRSYKLFLVTSGDRATQTKKIELLQLQGRFEEIFVVDPADNEHKANAFSEAQIRAKAPAARCLSVGNRVDTDVAEARLLGWRACWLRYGEYVHMPPRTILETPDFQIDSLKELTEACGL